METEEGQLPVQLKAYPNRSWCRLTSHARCERITIAYNPNTVVTGGVPVPARTKGSYLGVQCSL